jgi:hypothetical protein
MSWIKCVHFLYIKGHKKWYREKYVFACINFVVVCEYISQGFLFINDIKEKKK